MKESCWKRQYKRELNTYDKNGNNLTAEHLDYIKKEFPICKDDLGIADAFYYLAVDFCVPIVVIRKIVGE